MQSDRSLLQDELNELNDGKTLRMMYASTAVMVGGFIDIFFVTGSKIDFAITGFLQNMTDIHFYNELKPELSPLLYLGIGATVLGMGTLVKSVLNSKSDSDVPDWAEPKL